MSKERIRAIEVSFAQPVELTNEDMRDLDALLGRISRRYVEVHPDRVMWPFGHGAKILVHPMMLLDDEPIPFDDTIYSVEVAERENHDWPCAKCGKPLKDHYTPLLGSSDGCDYEPAKKPQRG